MDAGATFANDDGTDPRYWSPVHYLSSLAKSNPLHLATYGENTGQGSAAMMNLSVTRMKRYGLLGMCRYSEPEPFSEQYATLADYQRNIASSQ